MRFNAFGACVRIEFGIFLIIAVAILLGNTDVLYVILYSALHEIGHIIVLLAFGGKADEIVISYYGIGLKHSCDMVWYKEIVFLLAGVLVNALCYMLGISQDINLALLIVNSLPIYPLDGGRALKVILNKLLFVTISDKIYLIISAVFIALLVFYAITHGNFSLLLIAVYAIIFAINNSYD